MKIYNKTMYILLAIIGSFVLFVQEAQANGFAVYRNDTANNLTQNHEDWRQFELTAGQARSRVEHTLVNYLLGQTIDQYLDFGADDDSSRKSTKRLKLRLNHHRAVLIYRYTFY